MACRGCQCSKTVSKCFQAALQCTACSDQRTRGRSSPEQNERRALWKKGKKFPRIRCEKIGGKINWRDFTFHQGCQMVYFHAKSPNLGGPWNGKCWYIFGPFGNFVVIWYAFPFFGIVCQEKSGKPAYRQKLALYSTSETGYTANDRHSWWAILHHLKSLQSEN
jgi:hypothetical protein